MDQVQILSFNLKIFFENVKFKSGYCNQIKLIFFILKLPINSKSFKVIKPIKSQITAIKTLEGLKDSLSIKAGSKSLFSLVLDKTNFYAEKGGQMFDIGWMVHLKSGTRLFVQNVQSQNGYVLHCINVCESKSDVEICVGDELSLEIDNLNRTGLAKNHTATHILCFLLR